ncbi:hypothetical protein ASG43_09195 [Aureimonas sp. Leaf454]|uniref:hypothetical protein n=1 Tax=Aureimonas sp. Leaf454 TaxID=1736381 RepID=UPI0006F20C04|nr:hypothetical protein [Aureimonas sp. Leaf454]KQT48996.1 hypothetical protein ASG43_09195 [Aureimonas sp. Leaf454]
MNIHVPAKTASYRIERYDRVTYNGRTYRHIGKDQRIHILQLVDGDYVQDHFARLSDADISKAIQRGTFAHEPGFFSLIAKKLQIRQDDTDLQDLDERGYARIHLRHRWVREFLKLESENGYLERPRVGRSARLLGLAIRFLSPDIGAWYADTFEGWIATLKVHAVPQVPSASTLYALVRAYEAAGFTIGALREKRSNCGNREQLRPEVRAVIAVAAERYMSLQRPSKADIVKDVHDAIDLLNADRPASDQLCRTSPRIVRKQLDALDPFSVMAGRKGQDAAERWFTMVGKGIVCDRPLQRIEIDDWEVDLQALLCRSDQVHRMTKKQLGELERVRCTLSAAIDCRTSAIVGINLSAEAPSGHTSKSCLRSVVSDKTGLAAWAKCEMDWPMYGRPAQVVTDKGPAFRLEFEDAVRETAAGRSIPDADPRMRGHIERFFGTLKGQFPAWFSGRTFSNVVEKGDYDAEAMASLTLEDLLKFVVRWIVDVYHNTPHVALDGQTPRNAWLMLANDEEGIPPPPSADDITRIFGLRHRRKLGREGILFLDNHYVSDDVAWLLRNESNREIVFRINPDDLGSILLEVPEDVRGRDVFGGRSFVTVPCLNEELIGIKLGNWLTNREDWKDFVELEAEAGRKVRAKARADLFNGGFAAMAAAGIPNHCLTQSAFDKYMKGVGRKQLAAFRNPADRKTDKGSDEPLGRLAALAETTPAARADADKTTRRKAAVPERFVRPTAEPMQGRFENLDSDFEE